MMTRMLPNRKNTLSRPRMLRPATESTEATDETRKKRRLRPGRFSVFHQCSIRGSFFRSSLRSHGVAETPEFAHGGSRQVRAFLLSCERKQRATTNHTKNARTKKRAHAKALRRKGLASVSKFVMAAVSRSHLSFLIVIPLRLCVIPVVSLKDWNV